jgi:hypothetical protein
MSSIAAARPRAAVGIDRRTLARQPRRASRRAIGTRRRARCSDPFEPAIRELPEGWPDVRVPARAGDPVPGAAVQALHPDHPACAGADRRRGGRGWAPQRDARALEADAGAAAEADPHVVAAGRAQGPARRGRAHRRRRLLAKTDRVLALHEEGHRIAEIAGAVGLSVPTVYYHLGNPRPGAARVGEARSLLTLLAFAGLRIGEALALRNRDLRLHAQPRRLDVLYAKPPTGIREVHLSPQLAEVLILHGEQGRREARPTGNHDFLWTADDRGPRSYIWALKKVNDRPPRVADVRQSPGRRRPRHGPARSPAMTAPPATSNTATTPPSSMAHTPPGRARPRGTRHRRAQGPSRRRRRSQTTLGGSPAATA